MTKLFQNTIQALEECSERLTDEVTIEESNARKRLMELCCRLADKIERWKLLNEE